MRVPPRASQLDEIDVVDPTYVKAGIADYPTPQQAQDHPMNGLLSKNRKLQQQMGQGLVGVPKG